LLAALPLLDVPSSSRPHQASLSISSLGRKLCSNGCPSELSELISKLSEPLGISCGSRSREEREEVKLNPIISLCIFKIVHNFFLNIR